MAKKIPYTVLAFGDSIVQGQGLEEKDNFVCITARRLAKKSGRTPLVLSFAHSGAAIRGKKKSVTFVEAQASRKHEYAEEKLFVHRSIGQLNPAIQTQIRIAACEKGYEGYLDPHPSDIPSHRAHKKNLKKGLAEMDEPDLIILNGGVNDFNPYRVFVPFSDELMAKLGSKKMVKSVLDSLSLYTKKNDFKRYIDKNFYTRLKELLVDVRKRWPKTTIVVTGYFPTFTSGSFEGEDDAALPLMLYAHLRMKKAAIPHAKSFSGYVELYTKLGRRFLEERSMQFNNLHMRAMQKACKEIQTSQSTILFATPSFGPDNGAFAKKAWLFGWEPVELDLKAFPQIIDIFSTQDPMEGERKRATDAYLTYFKKEITLRKSIERRTRAYRTAVAHPNKKGAKAYADAIIEALQKITR